MPKFTWPFRYPKREESLDTAGRRAVAEARAAKIEALQRRERVDEVSAKITASVKRNHYGEHLMNRSFQPRQRRA